MQRTVRAGFIQHRDDRLRLSNQPAQRWIFQWQRRSRNRERRAACSAELSGQIL